MQSWKSCFALSVVLAISSAGWAAEKPAVVCNVKVLSDKVEDVSSLEAWKKSFIKDGMTDQEKALAIWKSVVSYVYDTSPPQEYLTWENGVDDPIKCFNVYGYDLCNDIASLVCGLARYSGLKAQGQNLQGHNACDVWYDNSWHYLDAAFIGYFPKADGKLASTEEVFASVKSWYADHADMKGDDNMNKRRAFAKNEGWKNGPDAMRNSPLYDKDGNLPYSGKSWATDMREFDGKVSGLYETGYSNGYKVNIQLRSGETLVRNWSNKGLHVNMLGGKGGEPNILKTAVGKGELKHTPQYGDLANGRIGNGTLQYEVLRDLNLAQSALTFKNLAFLGDEPILLAPANSANEGVLVIRMPSPYVYLSGELTFNAAIGDGGSIAVSLSDNNGLDWKDIATVDKSGEQKIDLKKFIGRRYDYRLKFILKANNTTLSSLKISHDIQHSQRALPALDKGDNTISFSAGAPESTITMEGSSTAANKDYQLVLTDFHPTLEGMEMTAGVKMTGGKGTITFPIETPGEMTAIRVGTFYRARDAKDTYVVEASFDNGGTWKKISTCPGGFRAMGDYAVFTDVPKGTTKALVRHSGTQGNTLMIFNERIDADYKVAAAGFAPVQVTYVWEEDGKEKKDVHVAQKADESWKIHCDGKPVMKSITLELAP